MTHKSWLPRLALWIAHKLYVIDGWLPRPANIANIIYDVLERRGLCCERHATNRKVA